MPVRAALGTEAMKGWHKEANGDWRCGPYLVTHTHGGWDAFFGAQLIGTAHLLEEAKAICHTRRMTWIEDQAHAHSA